MTVYRDERDGKWRYRKRLRLQDRAELRISGAPPINTKVAAETAERTHILRVQTTPSAPTQSPRKETPSFGRFAEDFMASYARANNKPSEQTSKTSILKTHLLPAFDRVPLDRIGVQDIERLKATLLEKVSRKRVNNVLNVLSKILKYAEQAGLLLGGRETLDVRDDAGGDQATGETGRAQSHGLARSPSHVLLAPRDEGSAPSADPGAGWSPEHHSDQPIHALAPGELRSAIALLDRSAVSGQQVANRPKK